MKYKMYDKKLSHAHGKHRHARPLGAMIELSIANYIKKTIENLQPPSPPIHLTPDEYYATKMCEIIKKLTPIPSGNKT